jgi:hypothetical protein
MPNRLFTFGCSFTNYHWPTYADILAKQFDSYSNWGESGAGNFFIFNSLIEAIKREKINKDDTVCIMWSSIAREDRYVNNKWLLSGSIYTQEIYDESFIKQFADPTGYLLRDLSYISASKQILSSLGCKWYFFSIVPLACYEDCIVSWFDIDKKIIDLYKDDIASIRPSVYETIFNYDWNSRIGYRNFNEKDHSKNTLVFDFLMLGELFQNNHHHAGSKPNFAAKWWEIDPVYPVIKVLDFVGIIKLARVDS